MWFVHLMYFVRTTMVALGVVCSATALRAATLDDTVRQAVASSPSIGEAQSNRFAAEEDVLQARGAYLPKLDAEATIGPQWADKPRSLSTSQNRSWSDARQAALVLRQPLFDGFARDSDLLRQQARAGGALSRVVEQAHAVALAAIEAHVDVVRQREVLRAADANVEAHRAIQKDVETRFAGGGAAVSELEQIRERVAAAEASRQDFARTLGLAVARYEKVVGLAPAQLSPPRAPRTPVPPADKAVAMAFSGNPSLEALRSEATAAEADVDVARARFAPQVGVELRGSRGEDLAYAQGRANEASGRVTLGWNLFNGGIDDARVRQRAEIVNAQRFKLDKLAREIRESVAADWATRRTSVERIAALRRALDLSRKVVTAYTDEYRVGRRSLLDVLDARAASFQAEVNLAGAEAVALMAQYRLLATTGQIGNEFRLAATSTRVTVPAPPGTGLR